MKKEVNIEKLPIKGYLFLISTAFFTALSYALGKALGKGQDPETTTFFWFFGAFIFALILVPFLPSQKFELKNIGKYKKIFLWSSILTSIGAALWIISLWTIGAPLTSFLMKAQTVFSLLLGVFFLGERLNRGETIGILITIPGGIIVAYQSDTYLLIGTITALSAAFFYSLLSFTVKKIAQNLNMLTVATLRCLGVSITLFFYLIVTGTFQMPTLKQIIIMAFGGITGAYIAKASQFQAIKLLDISRTTAVMPLESIFVVLLSYFLFDDLPSVLKLIGGAGIIIGVVFLVIFRAEKSVGLDK
ncbi:MAG: EamA family transporter [Candidatus Dadabacteria bacterium]|nr:EamA family transporter [Candidatus Dadabacteria bacterium]NIQ13027.1 EamA family transporter [Candidatus Dadabacteria bacterium]